MLSAITEGSLASSPRIRSAGGDDEHPCEGNNSITARGSARARGGIATTAHMPSAPDHPEIRLWAIIAVIPDSDNLPRSAAANALWRLTETGLRRGEGGPS